MALFKMCGERLIITIIEFILNGHFFFMLAKRFDATKPKESRSFLPALLLFYKKGAGRDLIGRTSFKLKL